MLNSLYGERSPPTTAAADLGVRTSRFGNFSKLSLQVSWSTGKHIVFQMSLWLTGLAWVKKGEAGLA